jgi:NAD(P)-dependent dehydrogenase (short-subunit alcohol dehydrogenase family)
MADELRFDGRTVVITGAGGGMGRSHALLLASRGASVVVNDLGADAFGRGASEGPAREVAGEIIAAGGQAVATTDTVATSEGCERIIATALKAFGRVDAVVHNAGIGSHAPITELSDESFDAMLRVHLYGGFSLTRAAWPHMVAQGGGRLLYITSEAGLYGRDGLAHYAPAKLALVALARVAHLEGEPVGIRANALGVGAYTRMVAYQLADYPGTAAWWQRYVRPELVSPAVLWLVHRSCPESGATFEAVAGRVSRVFIGETRGYTNLSLTPEDLRDHWARVSDRSSSVIPAWSEEFWRYLTDEVVAAGAEPPAPDD